MSSLYLIFFFLLNYSANKNNFSKLLKMNFFEKVEMFQEPDISWKNLLKP